MQNQNKTVLKSLQILNLFLDHEQLSFQEIVQLSRLPKTSAHRMVSSLEDMGFLSRNMDGKYELGLLFLQFGHLVAERLNIRKVALPIMRRLKEETGEAVNLVVRDDNEAIYIEKVDTTERLRVYTQIGRRAPLYGGACPRILLAFLPEQERERYIEQTELISYANQTITDKQVLRDVLRDCRKNGFSISHSELENDSSAIGAPIFNYESRAVAGISVVGAEIRFRNEQYAQNLVAKVTEAARDISYLLGWKPSQ
ncbi:MAG: IclR family transcriptional regulator [Ectobacillus sp.]